MTHHLVAMPKRLDAAALPKTRKMLAEAFEKDADIILLDFKDCDFIDSRGLSVIVTGLKKSESLQKTLRLVHVGEEVRLLLQITRFDRVCDIHETLETATL